jgi:hypothetical protein
MLDVSGVCKYVELTKVLTRVSVTEDLSLLGGDSVSIDEWSQKFYSSSIVVHLPSETSSHSKSFICVYSQYGDLKCFNL